MLEYILDALGFDFLKIFFGTQSSIIEEDDLGGF